MSGDQDDFLSRWSRRKREVAEAEADVEQPQSPAAKPAEASQAAAERDELPFDPKSLPSIESITAATDIRPFLAAGVPAELKHAALRRAWSADPAIRDFIGLSENSWDFNAPGSMGGFGPLEMTDDLRRMIAQLFTPTPAEQAVTVSAPKQLPAESRPPSVETREDVQSAATTEGEISAGIEESVVCDQLSQSKTNVVAVQQRSEEEIEDQSTGPRCHGGALPK